MQFIIKIVSGKCERHDVKVRCVKLNFISGRLTCVTFSETNIVIYRGVSSGISVFGSLTSRRAEFSGRYESQDFD